MAYTTIPKSTDYFDTSLWTGNSTSRLIPLDFEPSFVWGKARSVATQHALFDAVRGATGRLKSDTTGAEVPNSGVTAFNSNGFTNGTSDSLNQNGQTFASWNWKANGSGSANTDGSINSTVSASTTSGFSIVKYTGTQATATVGHGLGIAPKMIFFKNVDIADEWLAGVNAGSLDFTQYAYLNLTNAFSGNGAAFFNDTNPTSSVFSLGNSSNINKSGSSIIAYCFADVQGFSKIGSYIGNGNADGTFVYTGFKPAFILIKSATTAMYWHIFDDKRQGFNPNNYRLNPNSSEVETTTTGVLDFLSNGFKIRTNQQQFGTNGATYIYMAFAAAPFVANSGQSIPTTAR
jgi:hypothetical protein